MTELATDAFRTVGPSDAIPNDFVVPYYLDDRKLRISIARVDDRLYAFDDLCTCTPRGMPALRRPAHGDDDHVPMPRLPVRHHHRSRDQRPGDRGTQRVRGARGRRQHSNPGLTCFDLSRPAVDEGGRARKGSWRRSPGGGYDRSRSRWARTSRPAEGPRLRGRALPGSERLTLRGVDGVLELDLQLTLVGDLMKQSLRTACDIAALPAGVTRTCR